MSYARFSDDSDVYVYADCYGGLTCCGCSLGGSVTLPSTAEMLAHLAAHRAAGHAVPDYCVDGLKGDAAENDAFSANVEAGMCARCYGSGECLDYAPHDARNPAACVFCGGTKKCGQCNGAGGSPEWTQRTQSVPARGGDAGAGQHAPPTRPVEADASEPAAAAPEGERQP